MEKSNSCSLSLCTGNTVEPVIPNTMTETVIRDVPKGEPVLVQDESWVEGFLNQLNKQVISDDSIIRILRKAWNGEIFGNGRNNTAMAYAGILCKAGVEPGKGKGIHRGTYSRF